QDSTSDRARTDCALARSGRRQLIIAAPGGGGWSLRSASAILLSCAPESLLRKYYDHRKAHGQRLASLPQSNSTPVGRGCKAFCRERISRNDHPRYLQVGGDAAGLRLLSFSFQRAAAFGRL